MGGVVCRDRARTARLAEADRRRHEARRVTTGAVGRLRSSLPEGTAVVGAGLFVGGASAYVFFKIGQLALGQDGFKPIVALWFVLFTLAPGFLLPIEQEASRAIAHRRATGTGYGPVVRRMAGLAAAVVAVLALAASGKFFLATHGMRPDVLFATFLVGCLWLIAAHGNERPRTTMFTAGLIMGLSTDVHINGFFLSPVPAVFWIAAAPLTLRAVARGLVAYGGGLGVGFLLWAGLHYAPDPALFHRQLPIMGGATHGFRLIRLGVLGALAAESDRYIDWFWNARGHRHVPEAICILAGMAWSVLQGGRTLRATVVAWVALFLSSAVFLSNPFGWYLIYVWPLFSIWMACAFVATRRAAVAWSCAAMLLATHACDAALWTYKAVHDTRFDRQVAHLRDVVPADAAVIGSGCWWFAFWDRDFTDIAYVTFRTLENRETVGDAGIWPTERSRLGWSYVVASNRFLRQLDPSLPEDVACGGPNADASNALTARRYVQSHTMRTHTLEGLDNEALVFLLTPDARR